MVQMNNGIITNPVNTVPPYYFGGIEGWPEGKVNSVQTLLKRFEPIDLLDSQALWICDSIGNRLRFLTDDSGIIERNEYPADFRGIRCEVVSRKIDPKTIAMIRSGQEVQSLD
jgi:hypothetical protein